MVNKTPGLIPMRDVIDFILALTLFAVLICMPPKSWGCDCTWYAYSALKAHGIRMATVPAVAVTDDIKYPGVYSRGVVYVKDIENCRVRLHEFVHHVQWLHYGDAVELHEWNRRELQAAMITMIVETQVGTCK